MTTTPPRDAPREMTRAAIEENIEHALGARGDWVANGADGLLAFDPADFISALTMALALLDLRARIAAEATRQRVKYDRWKADGTADEATTHAAWHTAMVLRALTAPKEQTDE